MWDVPIVVHRPSPTGGRRVTLRSRILGLAHDDPELVLLLQRAGIPDASLLLDDPSWVEWRGAAAHDWDRP
ncbi:hypothetical protein [Streptomyces fuscigenes]|uniref:hypothetical protein n=1 Tax=Streptomyces fuscigenes TaxID=1528880 RepID=UPI001F484141|nr:hypothetical protein [Streptomyces fuscigenes]MCF3962309.1 hypothetical protein [Streptomyces fuscigenes]